MINRLAHLYQRISLADTVVPVYATSNLAKFRRPSGPTPDGPPDPYAGYEYIDRIAAVKAEHTELVGLIRKVNELNAARFREHGQGAPPVPGTTGEPIAEPALPEAGKQWEDRKVEFPPKVPPFNTLEKSYTDVVQLINDAYFEVSSGAGAADKVFGYIGRKTSIEDVTKAYASWRKNWGDMVKEWLPVHAGRGELPVFLEFMKGVGPIKGTKCTLVKNDDHTPFGPENARWTISRMRLSSNGYPYAKAKAAYQRLEDSSMPIALRWKGFKDFIADVGFPSERKGGPPVELAPKDSSRPIGKGNAMWVSRPLSLFKKDVHTYKRTRYFWDCLRGPLTEECEWPIVWDDFEVFVDPNTGPGPVPPPALSRTGSQRPRWLLLRRDKDFPHGAVCSTGEQNSFWGEDAAGIKKAAMKRRLGGLGE